MIKNSYFSRIISLFLLAAFTFVSCPFPYTPPPDEYMKSKDVLIPGLGTPRYFYLDSDHNIIENDSGPGATGLIVENNPMAEGVLFYSDDTGADDRVSIVYNKAIISMFFRKNAYFPYRMIITDESSSLEAFAYFSAYNNENQTYHITFQVDGQYHLANNLVLNKNIFTVYQNDPDLSASQNRRMKNMTVAMGIYGGLYGTIEKENNTSPFARGFWSNLANNIFRPIAAVFSYVAVAAVAIANIVVPIVSFFSPSAGLAFATGLEIVRDVSLIVTIAAIKLADFCDMLDDKNSPQRKDDGTQQVIKEELLPVASVSRVSNNTDHPIKFNEHGSEEFHIKEGNSLVVKLYMPGLHTAISEGMELILKVNESFLLWVDGMPSSVSPNGYNGVQFIHSQSSIMYGGGAKDEATIILKRLQPGFIGTSGKISIGMMLVDVSQKPLDLDLTVNGYQGGMWFRLPNDRNMNDPELFKNIIVINFCLKPFEECDD